MPDAPIRYSSSTAWRRVLNATETPRAMAVPNSAARYSGRFVINRPNRLSLRRRNHQRFCDRRPAIPQILVAPRMMPPGWCITRTSRSAKRSVTSRANNQGWTRLLGPVPLERNTANYRKLLCSGSFCLDAHCSALIRFLINREIRLPLLPQPECRFLIGERRCHDGG